MEPRPIYFAKHRRAATKNLARLGLLLMLVSSLGACVVPTRGVISPTGFEHTQYKYQVRNAGSELMGKAWLLDNFYVTRSGKTKPKEAGEYVVHYALDRNGDGEIDIQSNEPRYDLRFMHKQRSGLIWLRTIPLEKDHSAKALRVLMHQYVDNIAGAGYELASLGSALGVFEQRFAAEIVEQGEAKVADRDAYFATINVANIDQVHMTPSKRITTVRLVFVRPPFEYSPKGYESSDDTKYPVLMLAGFASLPEDFASDLPDFSGMLGRIVINEVSGFTLTPMSPPPPSEASQAEL